MSGTDSSARHAIVPCASCGKLNRVNMDKVGATAVCGTCKSALHVDAPVVLTDANFDVVVSQSTVPVMVDFYADWCGPCKMIGPSLEEISDELAGKVTIAKINIDENPDAPGKYGVRGIPTMILFKNGAPAATKVGAAPKSALKGWIESEI